MVQKSLKLDIRSIVLIACVITSNLLPLAMTIDITCNTKVEYNDSDKDNPTVTCSSFGFPPASFECSKKNCNDFPVGLQCVQFMNQMNLPNLNPADMHKSELTCQSFEFDLGKNVCITADGEKYRCAGNRDPMKCTDCNAIQEKEDNNQEGNQEEESEKEKKKKRKKLF
ncbi:hypothetical protein BY996DRAFT_7519074 [Phakopsora pachyrhizi]|nr:hypothetical protein BY996DRAFT_7519074 [Phakopsora pachyrhizi]